jgi:flagellar export protein FliJ
MAFRFTLESVLTVRSGFERLERNRLHLLAAAAARLREAIAAQCADSAKAAAEIEAKLRAGITSVELGTDLLSQSARAERRRSLEAQLGDLVKKQQKQQLAYFAAKARREILTNLRERKFAQYRAEQTRREQARLDELFLLRLAGSHYSPSE